MTARTIAIDTPRAYPPRVSAFTRPFWDALTEGRLVTTRCTACGKATFPPKPICPHCWTNGIAWEEISPEGSLYSWTRIHAGPAAFDAELPYAVGVVDLLAGLRVACRLHGDAATDWRCDMPVSIVALVAPDGPMIAAVPCASSIENA